MKHIKPRPEKTRDEIANMVDDCMIYRLRDAIMSYNTGSATAEAACEEFTSYLLARLERM